MIPANRVWVSGPLKIMIRSLVSNGSAFSLSFMRQPVRSVRFFITDPPLPITVPEAAVGMRHFTSNCELDAVGVEEEGEELREEGIGFPNESKLISGTLFSEDSISLFTISVIALPNAVVFPHIDKTRSLVPG